MHAADRVGTRRLLLFNFAALVVAYAALFTAPRISTSYRIVLVAGALVVGSAALLTFHRGVRVRLLATPTGPWARAALALVPWLVMVALITQKGLWWTQRAAPLRVFVLYLLANWSAAWCTGSRSSLADPAFSGPRKAGAWLSALLIIVGIEGAGFGVNTFGCGVSAAVAAIGALTLAVAAFGSRSASLKVITASLATLVAVVPTETAVRILHIGQNVQEVDSREYARQFYSLTPPQSVFVNAPKSLDEFGPALISINSRGIRGPELADPRADVLLIGDSMIEARQLPWEETLGPKLQHAMTARGLGQRVVAHGMRGWSPLLEWNWYLKVGRQLHPRIVMLFFFWNDLWTAGDEASTFSARLRPDGRPDHFDVPVDSNWIWYKHVRIIRLAEDVWHRLTFEELRRAFATVRTRQRAAGTLDDEAAVRMARTLTDRPLTGDQMDALLSSPEGALTPELRSMSRTSLWPSLRPWDLWTPEQRSAAARTELELQRFAEDVASDGGRLVIVYVPNPLQVGDNECAVGRLFERVDTNTLLRPESGIQTWLRGVAERHALELLDPSAAMRAFDSRRPADDTAPLYLRADCHWSERGHQFMADYLADWIQRNAPTNR